MEYRLIDVFDEDDLAQFHRIVHDAEAVGRPHATTRSLAETKVAFLRPSQSERMEAYGAFHGAEMVGAGTGFLPLLDNTAMGWFKVHVAPENRCRGIGSALAGFVVRRARESARPVMLSEAYYPFEARDGHPYRRFAERHGFILALSNVRRRLDLPVAANVLEGLEAQAEPSRYGYRIETFRDGIPDELLPSYCHVHNQLAVDAPSGDVDFEEEAMTPPVAKEYQAALAESGSAHYCTVAIDRASQVVAYTNLTLPPEQPSALQGGTLVLRAHRGHRLGLAIKARNLRAMSAGHPDRDAVFACNAEANAHMVGINEALGFRPVEIEGMFQRKLGC